MPPDMSCLRFVQLPQLFCFSLSNFPISSTAPAYCIYAEPSVAKLHLLLPPHLLVLRHLTCLDVGQAVPGLHPRLERDVMEGHQTGDEDHEQDAGEEEVGVPSNSTGESCFVIY